MSQTPESFASQLKENNPRDYKVDSFLAAATVANRHTYFAKNKSKFAPSTTAKRGHIRLRARQVLCHRCKGICSENGKNVLRRGSGKNTKANLCVKTFTLVPRLKRLGENEIEKFKNSDHSDICCDNSTKNNETSPVTVKIKLLSKSEAEKSQIQTGEQAEFS